VSYLVSFWAVWTVRTPLSPPARRGSRGPRGGLLAGPRWLWNHRPLRAAAPWLCCAGALFTPMGLLTLVLAAERGATPAEIGVLFTITGLGGLAGALATPWLLRRVSARSLLAGYGRTASAAAAALLGADSVWLLGVVGAVAFLPVPAVNALVYSRLAADVPDALHGSAVSAATQLTTLLHPVAPAVTGIALELAGSTARVLAGGALFVLLAAVAMVAVPSDR
jgi:predicted MFS family arabinose efflux permease